MSAQDTDWLDGTARMRKHPVGNAVSDQGAR